MHSNLSQCQSVGKTNKPIFRKNSTSDGRGEGRVTISLKERGRINVARWKVVPCGTHSPSNTIYPSSRPVRKRFPLAKRNRDGRSFASHVPLHACGAGCLACKPAFVALLGFVYAESLLCGFEPHVSADLCGLEPEFLVNPK